MKNTHNLEGKRKYYQFITQTKGTVKYQIYVIQPVINDNQRWYFVFKNRVTKSWDRRGIKYFSGI